MPASRCFKIRLSTQDRNQSFGWTSMKWHLQKMHQGVIKNDPFMTNLSLFRPFLIHLLKVWQKLWQTNLLLTYFDKNLKDVVGRWTKMGWISQGGGSTFLLQPVSTYISIRAALLDNLLLHWSLLLFWQLLNWILITFETEIGLFFYHSGFS